MKYKNYRHENLEVFFQIVSFTKYLRRILSLVELVLLKPNSFTVFLQNINVNIKNYLSLRTAFGDYF